MTNLGTMETPEKVEDAGSRIVRVSALGGVGASCAAVIDGAARRRPRCCTPSTLFEVASTAGTAVTSTLTRNDVEAVIGPDSTPFVTRLSKLMWRNDRETAPWAPTAPIASATDWHEP